MLAAKPQAPNKAKTLKRISPRATYKDGHNSPHSSKKVTQRQFALNSDLTIELVGLNQINREIIGDQQQSPSDRSISSESKNS